MVAVNWTRLKCTEEFKQDAKVQSPQSTDINKGTLDDRKSFFKDFVSGWCDGS